MINHIFSQAHTLKMFNNLVLAEGKLNFIGV